MSDSLLNTGQNLGALTLFFVMGCSLNKNVAPLVENDMSDSHAPAHGTNPDVTGDEMEEVDVGVLIQDTIALEVSYWDDTGGTSQDADRIASVVGFIADGTVSMGGGIPRCQPTIWVRFVPPTAEGGVTALFCSREDVAHIWIPEVGAASLDSAASLQLFDALSDQEAFSGPQLLPIAVGQSASYEITFHVLPEPGHTTLQALSFVTEGIRTEPDLVHTDGSERSRTVVVSGDAARALSHDLLSTGFFARAGRYYSPSTAEATHPPPGEEGPPPGPSTNTPGQVTVTVVEGDWHRTWSETMHPTVFAHLVTTIQRGGSAGEHQDALDAMSAATQP